jgi:preprotein translocase subunit SecE
MRIGNSPASLLVIAAVILFLLAAFGIDLGSIAVVPL